MKKILLLILAVALSNCEISPRKAKAGNNRCGQLSTYCLDDVVYYVDFTQNGMKYRAYHSSYRGGVHVIINMTKDALEVEKLKLEIAKLKKGE